MDFPPQKMNISGWLFLSVNETILNWSSSYKNNISEISTDVEVIRQKATDFDESITLEAIFKYSGNDYKRWNSSQAAKVTGYVVTVEPGGFKEWCNCGHADLQDLQIEINGH